MTEQDKYDRIYTLQRQEKAFEDYGHYNHGRFFMDAIVASDTIESVLDVGCGHNQFIQNLRRMGVEGTGIDFSCRSADMVMDLFDIKEVFKQNEFDIVTAFDVMEHLLSEQVDEAIESIKWAGKQFAFSISYKDSINKVLGETLHPTIRPKTWWIDRITKHGGEVGVREIRYLEGKWK